jgi:hypothetical protein
MESKKWPFENGVMEDAVSKINFRTFLNTIL